MDDNNFDELSLEEIASLLGVDVATVIYRCAWNVDEPLARSGLVATLTYLWETGEGDVVTETIHTITSLHLARHPDQLQKAQGTIGDLLEDEIRRELGNDNA